jgi:competence protein ComGB
MDLFLGIHMKIPKAPLKPAIQLRFLQRLSRALSSGYSLNESLEVVKWDKSLSPIATDTIHILQDGNTLSIALEKLNFHPIIISFLSISQEYGDLENSIQKTVEIFDKRLEYSKKFSQVIRYPIVLIIVFSFLFFFIQHSVLPNLLTLMDQSTDRSFFLSMILNISSVLYYGFLLIVLLALAFRMSWQYLQSKIPIDYQLKLFQLIPIYRSYVTLNTSYLLATHVSSLLQTGISIKDVLAILMAQPKLNIISHYASRLTEGLNQGLHLSLLLHSFRFINPQLASIFQKNSNADTLEKDLAVYAIFLTDELHQKIMRTITYIQPIFFTLLGIVVILIYLSLMWPMYQIIETI